MLACLAAAVLFGAQTAHAQDPSTLSPSVQKSTAFPKQSMVGPSRNLDKSQPLYLQGDELVYDTGGNRVVARGNVEIYYNNYILTADQVVYDQSANTLTAVGNVVLKEPNGNIVRADRYTLTDDFRDGFVQSLSIVTSDDSRIAGDRAVRRGGNTTVFTNGRFTPCKSDDGMPPLWCISAATVIHDQQAATITYQDAQFELFGVPVLYAPYFEHADPSVKRKSGFLMPEYSSSSTLGSIVGMPYYFALAPNYDFTFNPLYMSRQGILWQGEWRHRLENGQYYIKLAGIDQNPNDLPSTIVDPDNYAGFRGSIETKGLFTLASWWHFGWDVTAATDDTFRRFYKLDNILATDVVNRVFLNGISERNYFSLEADQYISQQFLANGEVAQANKSYAHPMLDYNYVVADPWLGGEIRWNTNALSFSADQNPTAFAPLVGGTEQMNRLVTEIDWRKRFIDPIGLTYTPFAQLRGDIYALSDYVDPQDPQGRHAEHVASPRPGVGGRDHFLSVGCECELRLARHRAYRPDHRPSGDHQSERTARRGRQEPRLRRHEPVRHKQVLRLRPHRDRDTRQRRLAVHVPGQLRRNCAVSSRARASNSPASTLTSTPASTPMATRYSRQTAASRPIARIMCSAPTSNPSRPCSSSRSRASTRPASLWSVRTPVRS